MNIHRESHKQTHKNKYNQRDTHKHKYKQIQTNIIILTHT